MPAYDHCDDSGQHKPTLPPARMHDALAFEVDAVTGRVTLLVATDEPITLSEAELRGLSVQAIAAWSKAVR